MENIRQGTRRLALMGMLLAIIIVLSWLEHMLPPLPGLPPGIRLGLSNVVTMYALFFLGKGAAFTLLGMKSLFALLTRGFTAGLLSASGGLLSALMVILLSVLLKDKISYLLLSVAGAVMHNIGQYAAAAKVLGTDILLLYALPLLVAFGVVMGCVTGALLRVVLPLFQKTITKSYGRNP